jgi:surfeit locus 1 family protein
MRTRDKLFIVVAIAFAVGCVRLGIWQLARLGERRKFNASLIARADTKPVDLAALPTDTGARHFTRVNLSGTYDYDHEITLTNRTRNGSPGVNIVTPLKTGGDTAVLVNRGWVYAPDGMTVDLGRWRESPTITGEGFVENFRAGKGAAKSSSHKNAYRWLDRETIAQAFPYPIKPYFVVLIDDSGHTRANVPPRISVPPLDEGSHKNYAIQWFSFAAISIFGTILYLRRK